MSTVNGSLRGGSNKWDSPTAIDAACLQLSTLHEKLRNVVDDIILTKARLRPKALKTKAPKHSRQHCASR